MSCDSWRVTRAHRRETRHHRNRSPLPGPRPSAEAASCQVLACFPPQLASTLFLWFCSKHPPEDTSDMHPHLSQSRAGGILQCRPDHTSDIIRRERWILGKTAADRRPLRIAFPPAMCGLSVLDKGPEAGINACEDASANATHATARTVECDMPRPLRTLLSSQARASSR